MESTGHGDEAAGEVTRADFPEGFVFGVATSAYQMMIRRVMVSPAAALISLLLFLSFTTTTGLSQERQGGTEYRASSPTADGQNRNHAVVSPRLAAEQDTRLQWDDGETSKSRRTAGMNRRKRSATRRQPTRDGKTKTRPATPRLDSFSWKDPEVKVELLDMALKNIVIARCPRQRETMPAIA
ncbi:hypothetical protein QYE76_000205 [Lolium multiflorum]|uniref:Uncharacterized protein n=1 Tax=Lolium multiflorum TaxID=4521 RepID=A0AAD8VVR6_LOLMU|nr:hypothetical protein QYE76_000205 [Lolium multiflorum]